jgi:phosphate starvation-inducible PhoH-like protein
LEISIDVPSGAERIAVLGSAERNLKMIREALGVSVTAREGTVRLRGDRETIVAARNIIDRLKRDAPLSRQQVLDLIADESSRASDPTLALDPLTSRVGEAAWQGQIDVYSGGRPVRPKTENQRAYLEAIRRDDLVFGIGPAGTGKTYLAVAAAVHLLRSDRVRKLVLVRPAVEAGEKLGFLPGDVQEKVNPYLRPLLDALHDMMDYATIRRFMESDVVEVAPLAYMRGRTLNNSVIILDEAQNTTKGQMKMFLTRMGHGSKTIVTGDTTQIDLPDPRESGLIDAVMRLRHVKGVGAVTLDGADVVRHDLVQRIVEAYGEARPSDPLTDEIKTALSETSSVSGSEEPAER